jgi:hypothetical protein
MAFISNEEITSLIYTYIIKDDDECDSESNPEWAAANKNLHNLNEDLLQDLHNKSNFTMQFPNVPHAENECQEDSKLIEIEHFFTSHIIRES